MIFGLSAMMITNTELLESSNSASVGSRMTVIFIF